MAVVRWLLVGCALLLLVFWWLVTQGGSVGSRLSSVHLPLVWSPTSPSSQHEQAYSVLGLSHGLGSVHQPGPLGVSLSGCGSGPGAL